MNQDFAALTALTISGVAATTSGLFGSAFADLVHPLGVAVAPACQHMIEAAEIGDWRGSENLSRRLDAPGKRDEPRGPRQALHVAQARCQQRSHFIHRLAGGAIDDGSARLGPERKISVIGDR